MNSRRSGVLLMGLIIWGLQLCHGSWVLVSCLQTWQLLSIFLHTERERERMLITSPKFRLFMIEKIQEKTCPFCYIRAPFLNFLSCSEISVRLMSRLYSGTSRRPTCCWTRTSSLSCRTLGWPGRGLLTGAPMSLRRYAPCSSCRLFSSVCCSTLEPGRTLERAA